MLPSRLARAHPLFISLLSAVYFVAGAIIVQVFGAYPQAASHVVFLVASALVVIAGPITQLLWARGVHSGSIQRIHQVNPRYGSRKSNWVFTAAIIAHLLFVMLGGAQAYVSTNNVTSNVILFDIFQIAALMAAALTLAALWKAAEALVRAESAAPYGAWHHVVGTFLLMLYLIVGVWFLHPRIMRIAS